MEFFPGHTVGIDLGTTFSSIAHLNKEGNPVPLTNDEGEIEIPSLILLAESGHVIVGTSRNRAAIEDPDRVVERIKREMGNVEFKRTFDGHEITPEFLSALILKKLKQDAEEKIGPITNAVITVPYYFNDSRRKATQDAGRIAGLNVIDIINEPTAATLTYAWHQGELGTSGKTGDRPRLALVYDLGGGTFDVTLVRYTPTHFQVLATDGDVQLGGIDWNDRLLDYVAGEFKARHGLDPHESRATVQMLRNDCDQAKIALSGQAQATITCRHAHKSVSVTITREKFEELTSDLLQRTIDTLELVLDTAKVRAEQLDAIVLVGGSTLMPAVPHQSKRRPASNRSKAFRRTPPSRKCGHSCRRARSQIPRRKKLTGRIGSQAPGSDQAGRCQLPRAGGHRPSSPQRPLYQSSDDPAQQPAAGRKTQVFYTNEPNQQRVSIKVLEGDAPDPDACNLIGTCRVTGLPQNLPAKSPIEVTYSFDRSGRVLVRARDKTGGREAAIEIERRGGLNDRQIDVFTQLANEYKVE